MDDFLKQLAPLVNMVKAQVELQVDAGIAMQKGAIAVSTPYNFSTIPSEFGKSRPYLRDPISGNLSSDTEVLAAASGTCYAWDWGKALPPNLNTLLYGKP